MYPCISPKRCMCNMSTGHAQGPSQWVPVFSQVIPFPLLHYPDVYQTCKPVILQQTRVPNSLLMGINYVDYEPQGTEVIQACLQTTPYKGWPQWFSTTPE